jgi:hypothetical protein
MPRRMFLAFAIPAIVMAVGGVAWFGFGEERWFAWNLERIEVGTPREVVVKHLGEPKIFGTDCYVAQFVVFENPSPRAPAQYCAHWIGSSPFFQFYAVGFGQDDKVVWVAYGDS